MDDRFYMMVECPRCDEDVFIGPSLTFIEYRGLPVVPADMACQGSFECDECGLEFYTGDLGVDYDEGQPDRRIVADGEDGDSDE